MVWVREWARVWVRVWVRVWFWYGLGSRRSLIHRTHIRRTIHRSHIRRSLSMPFLLTYIYNNTHTKIIFLITNINN